jgi:hypothetical protein
MRSSGLETFCRANEITELPGLTRAPAVNRRAVLGAGVVERRQADGTRGVHAFAASNG